MRVSQNINQKYKIHKIQHTLIKNLKMKMSLVVYSVLNELPHEHDFVTFGLLILNPEPIKLSI